jgi:thiol:disulfide interchange protein
MASRKALERCMRPAFLLLFLSNLAVAQPPSPAHWTLIPKTSNVSPGSQFTAELQLKLDAPWHMYSLSTPKPGPTGGPIATTFQLADNPALSGLKIYQPAPRRKFDPNFQIETETYESEAGFMLTGDVAPSAPAGPLELAVQLRFQLCSDKECLPPRKVTVTAPLTVAPGAAATKLDVPPGLTLFGAAAAPSQDKPEPQSLGGFLLLAFGFGLASIFTPCVFPMIPVTMSFFLNQAAGDPKKSPLAQALAFSLGIIGLFTLMGLAVTALLGPFGVVQLGSNPWVNGFIAIVFFVFSLSLLGAFEITLPSGFLTWLNKASSGNSYAATLLMGLTFSLTSFACVGPFVGTLLAASVTGARLQPVLGMLSFAAGLAAPFFFLALFPGYLKQLPRSGGWMARVKIVLGFLILAAMLKYLSNVDQVLQWNLLTRERFIGLWVVLFALPGLYLLGFLRLEGIKPDESVGTGRLLAGIVMLGFALSLLPAMFGQRLGELEAYVPAPAEGVSAAPTAQKWIKNDLESALSRAKTDHKLVLVSFTGYACTNCHWMKANMFTRPEIAASLADLVLVELYTDGTDNASEANQKRQNEMFQSVAIPYYALLDGDGKVVASFAGLTKDPARFLAFLKTRA